MTGPKITIGGVQIGPTPASALEISIPAPAAANVPPGERIDFEDGSAAVMHEPHFVGSTLRRPLFAMKTEGEVTMAERWVRWEAELWTAAMIAVQHRARDRVLWANDETLLEVRLAYQRIKREWAHR